MKLNSFTSLVKCLASLVFFWMLNGWIELDGLKNIKHQAENKFISIRNVNKHRYKNMMMMMIMMMMMMKRVANGCKKHL